MDEMAIADRRHLRRKVTFWRVVAVLLLIAAGFAIFRMAFPSAGTPGRAHIARIDISGIITDDSELLERLDAIAGNDQVKALIVSISSPGGTTYGGERIFNALRKVAEKKPVVSDVRTMAASAGYMIAAAGDMIIAGETSITGSIGVIFQYPQIRPLMDKLGVSLEEIKSSPLKAEPSPFHEAGEDAKSMIRTMIMDSYDWFVDLVAERRKMDRETVLRLADGSIYTGRQALKAGLIDRIGDRQDILAWLETKGVDRTLPVVDWKARARVSPFSLAGLARLLETTAYGRLLPLPWGGGEGSEKLFLDGLVSVWQFDPA